MTTALFASALLAGCSIITSAQAEEDKAASMAITEQFMPTVEEQELTLDNSAYADVLAKYVSETEGGVNAFDYAGVTPEDRAKLQEYIQAMSALDPTKLTRDQKIAYWSNMYNAVTLEVVLANMPVKSIKEIELRDTGQKIEDEGFITAIQEVFTNDGPWEAPLVIVNGTELTLNNIEHLILRKMDEPRIHYSINCASYSCPNLLAEPWTAEGLDAALDAAAVDYINHPRAVMQDDQGKITVSSIYEWFQKDFGGDEAGVIAHMRPYAKDGTKVALETNQIDSFDYDWTLNSPDGIAEVEEGQES